MLESILLFYFQNFTFFSLLFENGSVHIISVFYSLVVKFQYCCREHSVNDKSAADKADLEENSNSSSNKQAANFIVKEVSIGKLNVSLGESDQTTLLKDL